MADSFYNEACGRVKLGYLPIGGAVLFSWASGAIIGIIASELEACDEGLTAVGPGQERQARNPAEVDSLAR